MVGLAYWLAVVAVICVPPSIFSSTQPLATRVASLAR